MGSENDIAAAVVYIFIYLLTYLLTQRTIFTLNPDSVCNHSTSFDCYKL